MITLTDKPISVCVFYDVYYIINLESVLYLLGIFNEYLNSTCLIVTLYSFKTTSE